jgi:outer membrane protein assembly factor BamE (lipoprotein component of BamABCDE complex)
MNKVKIILSAVLLFGMFSLSGCFVTKAGNYVSEKSKAGWSATKSFFTGDDDK